MVLLILAMLWGIVLIPPLLRNRSVSRAESKRVRALRRFRRRLAVLTPPATARRHEDASRPAGAARPHVALVAQARPVAGDPPATSPSVPAEPPSRSDVLRRRRQRLVILLAAMAGTLVVGALPPLRPVWVLHGLLDVLCLGYVAWLRRTHVHHVAATAKVRYLPTRTTMAADTAEVVIADAAAPLRRSALS